MTEENLEDLEAQICAEMTADEEREALKERIAALERENAALREGSDAAGLSALADIREALGVGGRPCLFELAGLVKDLVSECRDWRECARYSVTMESGHFQAWNRSALDRCRKKYVEGQ